jgi:hypothetical protein
MTSLTGALTSERESQIGPLISPEQIGEFFSS